MKMIREVLKETGITATAGIGTNLYLCKIAMDIVAKKMPPDKDGVRIAELDEMSYRRQLWEHTPLTDFWRVGRGIAARLAQYGIMTMGDIARCSIEHEDFLYSLFGVYAELLIDHAWGWEPVTMDLVKVYRPETSSLSSGQVLQSPYPVTQARNVVKEMADSLSLDLVSKRLVTDQIVLTVGYDVASLTDPAISGNTTEKSRSTTTGVKCPPMPTEQSGQTVSLHPQGPSSQRLQNCSTALFIPTCLYVGSPFASTTLYRKRMQRQKREPGSLTFSLTMMNWNGRRKPSLRKRRRNVAVRKPSCG